MIDWMIFYADGSTVSSEDCPPADVPGYAVQAIAQPDMNPSANVGYRVESGWDWYYWRTDSGQWIGTYNDRCVLDLIRSREPIEGLSSGMMISDKQYQLILETAQTWAAQRGWPTKIGVHSTERPLDI